MYVPSGGGDVGVEPADDEEEAAAAPPVSATTSGGGGTARMTKATLSSVPTPRTVKHFSQQKQQQHSKNRLLVLVLSTEDNKLGLFPSAHF